MRLVIFSICAAMLALTAPAGARELADAPEARILGFSADGRYMAFEQFINDSVSMQVAAAIDVIDRDTGRSAEGFPLGFLPLSRGGQFPAKVGQHEIKVDESQASQVQLETLRRNVREKSQARLDALGIRDNARRLAGQMPTDRSQAAGPVTFVLGATLAGGVPDQQPLYRIAARFTPADTPACIKSGKPRDHEIVLDVSRIEARSKKVVAKLAGTAPWPHGESDCAQTVAITDVAAHRPEGEAEIGHVGVLVLAMSWAPHAESAHYIAAFAKLP